MFLPGGERLVYNLNNFLSLLIIFPNFFHGTSYATWTTPSVNCKYPLMCVHTSHQPYGYSLLMLRSWQKMHWNQWCNLWHLRYNCMKCWFPCGTKIITCASFNHIQLFLLTNRHCGVTKDGIRTLTNIVNVDPIWCNSRICHLRCSSNQKKELLQATPQ
jgi:hypothetical protein